MTPAFLYLMKVFVTTERFKLREFLDSDAPAFYEMDSDPEVHKYLGGNTVKNLDETKKIMDKVRQQYLDNGIGRWTIEDNETGEVLGWSGLKFETGLKEGKEYYDLGYRLLKRYWGKGAATETAIASLDYGFKVMKLPEICAAADIRNTGSNKILRKIGMNYVEDFYWEDIKCHWYEMKNPSTSK